MCTLIGSCTNTVSVLCSLPFYQQRRGGRDQCKRRYGFAEKVRRVKTISTYPTTLQFHLCHVGIAMLLRWLLGLLGYDVRVCAVCVCVCTVNNIYATHTCYTHILRARTHLWPSPPSPLLSLFSPLLSPRYAAWIGGSMFASFSTFPKIMITRAQYEEEGSDYGAERLVSKRGFC